MEVTMNDPSALPPVDLPKPGSGAHPKSADEKIESRSEDPGQSSYGGFKDENPKRQAEDLGETDRATAPLNRAPSDHSGDPQDHDVLRSDTGPREDPPNRTMGNHPVDPNAGHAKTFPPGVDAKDARDPGRQTPGAPPVDNRSGSKS
jgi:hypothetical protein